MRWLCRLDTLLAGVHRPRTAAGACSLWTWDLAAGSRCWCGVATLKNQGTISRVGTWIPSQSSFWTHRSNICRPFILLEFVGLSWKGLGFPWFPMVSQFFDDIDNPKTSLHSRRSHHIGVHRGSPRGVIPGDSHGREFGCLSESTSLLHTFERRGSGYSGYTEVLWNGYGSIPINTIFSGMNIHLPAIWHTAKLLCRWQTRNQLEWQLEWLMTF